MAPQTSIDLGRVRKNINDIREWFGRLSSGEKIPAFKILELQKKITYVEGLLERHQALMDRTRDLTEKTTQIKDAYDEINEAYSEILAEYMALKQLPHVYVNFVRCLGEEEMVIGKGKTKKFPVLEVTDNSGIYRRVFLVAKDVKPEDLKRGERLIINSPSPESGGHVIAKAGEFDVVGEEATVENVLDRDREGVRVLIKSGERETVSIMHVADQFTEELKPGKRVWVNPRAGLVLGSLPDKESQKYVIPQIPKETFDDVRGLGSAILQIQKDMIWPIVHPDLYARFGKPRFKGYVLHGPPGCGKTMLTKALANEMARLLSEKYGVDIKGNFFYIGGTELLNKWIGNTEEWMRDIFAAADTVSKKTDPPSPAIITFDDAEVMFRTRGSGISSDVNESHVTQICTLLQGMEERGNVIVIFLTNRPEMMDPAVARHGRVSKTIYIPRPNREGVKSIFMKYLKADWNILHPKYHADVYPPTRDGKPILDSNGGIKRLQFANDPARVVDYLVEGALERMFGVSNELRNELLKVQYAGEKEPKVLRYGDFISGALISEGIMPEVLQMAITEAVEQEKNGEEVATGIRMKFVYEAIEAVFEEMRQTIRTRSPQDLAEWLAVQGHKLKPIVAIGLPNDISPEKTAPAPATSPKTAGPGDGQEDEIDEEEEEEL